MSSIRQYIKRIQIRDVNGRRHNLKFSSTLSDRKLEKFKDIAMRMILHAKMSLPFEESDLRYFQSCDTTTRHRLVKLGIDVADSQKLKTVTIKEICAKILKVKRGTTERKLTDVAKRLEEHFGKAFDAEAVGHDGAMEFQTWLRDDEKLSEATIARTCGYASQIWNYAIKSGMVKSNPWRDREIKKTVNTNEERHYYISDDETQNIWDVLQTDDDRIRFVLLRFLGLRAPSEINNLTWNDIDWQSQTIEIQSEKTRHDKDGGHRTTPITHPTVNRVLRQAYENRVSDDSSIVPRLSHRVLTKRVVAWLGRAGLDRWPQLLINFRRSAVTDACDVFPQHVVSAYFGHAGEIIRKHYAKVKPEHNKLMAGMKDLES